MQALWNNQVIADSDKTIVVEGNHYFSPEALNKRYFKDSDKTTSCFWKGTANYKHIVVNGENNPDAAWYYPEPKDKAMNIKGYYAFWRGVVII